jgi:pyridoxamine 5'-phosphate oxidase
MSDNPFALFATWMGDAKASGMREPTAMTVATANADGQPSARIVLLKEWNEKGFVFYTNSLSHKGHDLKQNPKAGLLFYWMELQRQIRIEGNVDQVTAAEADAYFATRRRESQLGAWASQQSEILENRDVLMERMNHYRLKFEGHDIPRPPHWLGYRVVPNNFEFWEEVDFRLHHRQQFTRSNGSWKKTLLNP